MSAAASSRCRSSRPTRLRARSPRCRARPGRARPRSAAERGGGMAQGPPPFALEGLDHVVLLVGDMEKARDFYCDVLGCTVDGALPEYGMLQLRAGAALIDLVDIGATEGAWAKPPVAGGRNMD